MKAGLSDWRAIVVMVPELLLVGFASPQQSAMPKDTANSQYRVMNVLQCLGVSQSL
jgi:hypothetical protein